MPPGYANARRRLLPLEFILTTALTDYTLHEKAQCLSIVPEFIYGGVGGVTMHARAMRCFSQPARLLVSTNQSLPHRAPVS